MSSGTLEAISTVLAFLAMILIFAWAFSKHRKRDFDEAANLPFADELPENEEGKK